MSQTVKQTNRYYACIGWPGREAWRVIESWKALFHRKFLSSFLLILTQI